MFRFPRFAIVCLALACVALSAPPALAQIRVGVLAVQDESDATHEFAPTIAHLNRALPGLDFMLVPLPLDALSQAAATGAVDFLITNPGHYVALGSRLGVTRIATIERLDSGDTSGRVGSTVIAPARPGHPQGWPDLSDLRIAITARDAFGGWQVALREMLDADAPPRGPLVETGFPMTNVIEALRAGHADAGVLRACLLETLIAGGLVGQDEFAVVAERDAGGLSCRLSSRLYPDWPFARLPGVDRDLARQVAVALLTMPAAEGRRWAVPHDYGAVQELFRELRLGAFEDMPHRGLLDYLRAHWHWFAGFALVVAWWAIHSARVEVLVRRRTAELTREMAERSRAEAEARQHREERDQYARLGILGEMASSIAHELNQPLGAITNYAEGLTRAIDRGKPDPAFLRDGVRGIAGQADRAGTIIRRIRSFLRRREPQREALDLNEVARGPLSLFGAAAGRRGIALRFDPAPDLPPVMGDRVEIEQVLLNLLQNALDASEDAPPGSEIRLSTASDGNMVTMTLRDHGSGLSPDDAPHIFDAFHTTKERGLGLGLPICRTIAESHGGELWAEPQPDGLAMHFSLPVATGPKEAE